MSSLSKYGVFLNLIGGNLVYISNAVYPKYTEEGLIINKEEYLNSLNNVINLGESSLQIIKTTNPPSFLKSEHDLFFQSFKRFIECVKSINKKIEEVCNLEINKESLIESLSSLKNVEDEFKVASIRLVEKVFSRR